MKKLFTVILMVVFIGCAMPKSQVISTDERPKISIQGAPQGTILYVDDLSMGDANQYNGVDQVLSLESGTHIVEIRSIDGSIIYQEKVFLGSELKKIRVK